MDELDIQRHTVVDWSRFLNSTIIGDENKEVEIDQSKFGKWKYHTGQVVKRLWVFIGVERGSNKCFIVQVEIRNKSILLNLIKHWI